MFTQVNFKGLFTLCNRAEQMVLAINASCLTRADVGSLLNQGPAPPLRNKDRLKKTRYHFRTLLHMIFHLRCFTKTICHKVLSRNVWFYLSVSYLQILHISIRMGFIS